MQFCDKKKLTIIFSFDLSHTLHTIYNEIKRKPPKCKCNESVSLMTKLNNGTTIIIINNIIFIIFVATKPQKSQSSIKGYQKLDSWQH